MHSFRRWALALGLAAPLAAAATELELVEAPDISDPAFALLVGSIEAEHFGVLTRARLEAAIAATGRPTELPVQALVRLERTGPEPPLGPRIVMEAAGPLDLPIPFQILGYHPGSIVTSRRVTLREWNLGRFLVPADEQEDDRGTFYIDGTRLWLVEHGELTVDIDGWLDVLLGAAADDTRVYALALFELDGERFAIAIGRNDKGANRYGTFDFAANELRFPNPKVFKAAGRALRRRAQWLLPSIVEAPAD